MSGVRSRIVLAWERLAYLMAVILPSRDVASLGHAHCPCLGESLLLEHGVCRISAQRLGLGEIRRFGQGRAAAFPQVGALALLAGSPKPGSCAPVFLPSRDFVPESPAFAVRIRQTLPSKDVVAGGAVHRPALGENRPFGRGWPSTLPRVDGSTLLAASPKPRPYVKTAGTLVQPCSLHFGICLRAYLARR